MAHRNLLNPILFCVLLAAFNFAFAANITNGSFNSDLSGWSVVQNGGTAKWESSGKSILSTGPDVAFISAGIVQGDDGLFNFSHPITIGAKDDVFKFEYSITSLGADPLEPGDGFADNLQVWLYDANGNDDTQISLFEIMTANETGFSFDLSPFKGHSVAFSFELNDEDDGFNTQVTLDNVRIETVVTPLPGALLFQASGLLALGAISKTVRRKQRPA